MVWQRAGTVSVQNGSTTVTGSGVDFAASSRVGDSFVGPDGATYEVANIASATGISILPAYKGATVSGASYSIMPVQGYDKMLSDAFNSLANQFGAKLAALGTTGNYDILPVAKGGTGNANGTATKLSAVGMVGSVSQTGGVATGTVIERGANANGDYLRFADGTQFCWKRIAADATSSPVGSIFGSGAFGAGPYPASFNAAPRVSHSGFIASGSADSMWSSCYTPATQTSWGNYRILSASASAAGYIDVVAVGRWF